MYCCVQVQCQLGELKAECDLYRSKLEAERLQIQQLQSLLAAERKKEFVSHMSSKEREEELKHVRQLMANLEADRSVRGGVFSRCCGCYSNGVLGVS